MRSAAAEDQAIDVHAFPTDDSLLRARTAISSLEPAYVACKPEVVAASGLPDGTGA